MGKIIEEIALLRRHRILKTLDTDRDWQNLGSQVKGTLIDFSYPETAFGNIKRAFDLGLPVVCGTTGWHTRLSEIRNICLAKNHSIVVASNFSIGVNVLFAINRQLASIMNNFPEYRPEISETHHIHKKDKPSGTAVTLAGGITAGLERIRDWSLEEGKEDELHVNSLREGEITGKHSVSYTSAYDRVSISHEAYDRKAFGLGAVVAAEWLEGRTGFYTMQDVLAI